MRHSEPFLLVILIVIDLTQFSYLPNYCCSLPPFPLFGSWLVQIDSNIMRSMPRQFPPSVGAPGVNSRGCLGWIDPVKITRWFLTCFPCFHGPTFLSGFWSVHVRFMMMEVGFVNKISMLRLEHGISQPQMLFFLVWCQPQMPRIIVAARLRLHITQAEMGQLFTRRFPKSWR